MVRTVTFLGPGTQRSPRIIHYRHAAFGTNWPLPLQELAKADAGNRERATVDSAVLIPRPIRDAVYRGVAIRRYQWFGRSDACGLPSEALKSRLG